MQESEIMDPVDAVVDYATGYSMPELYLVTSNAVLYRVRKAGKFFIIKTPKDNSGQGLAMLQREYELSLGKTHPNIVTVFTFEQNSVVGPGIVMEYVDGRTLTAFLAENPSPAMRERVFTQLLQAVAYVHRSGVVHNDIKPDNILVTRANNDVRLIDFGLADDDAHYLARTLGCTPAYASPRYWGLCILISIPSAFSMRASSQQTSRREPIWIGFIEFPSFLLSACYAFFGVSDQRTA